MYKLVNASEKLAYELTNLDGRPFHFLAAHLRSNPQGVRDAIIALNLPDWVPIRGAIIALDRREVARFSCILGGRITTHCLDFSSLQGDGLGNLEGSYIPQWVVYIPKNLVPERVMDLGSPFIVGDNVFLAAYNPTHNVLFAADFVHDIERTRRAEVAREFVAFLRSVGVPIPHEPIGEPPWKSVVSFPGERITFGADPEFELVKGRRIVRASGAVPRGEVRLPWGAIGVDGAGDPLELRPVPGTTPRELVDNVGRLLLAVPKVVGGVPSTMCEMYPIGGHLHIGFRNRRGVMNHAEEIVQAIDGELGEVFYSLNSRRRRESSYGRRGDWRSQEWGIEYRTPPAAIWSHPEAAMAFLEGVAHVVNTLVRHGEWDPEQDPLWARVKERVRKAAALVQKYEGRLHWGAWKKWVGDFHLTQESGVEVEFTSSAEKDDHFLDDLRLMLIRLGLPRVSVLPLRKTRGDYASNVPGYGVLAEGVDEFIPNLTLALSWRFRNDPDFRRVELPKLEEAIARLLDGDGDDGNRLIKEVIPLDGDWPDASPPEPIDEEEDDDEYTYCNECGARVHLDDAYYNRNDTPFCPDCYHELYTACDRCGRETPRIDALRYDDYSYCVDCYSELFSYCEECGEDYPAEVVEVVEVIFPTGVRGEMSLCTYCREEMEYDNEANAYRVRG